MTHYKYILIIVALLLSVQMLKAQFQQVSVIRVSKEVKYTGTVIDSLTHEPLIGAVISDISLKEGQIVVNNHITDVNGKFSYTVRKAEQRRIEVSYIGYRLYVQSLLQNESEVDLGKIYMSLDPYKLDEVIIRSRMAMYNVSGDTILYFPRAVKTMTGDPVIEILRQMPGVEVTEKGDVYIGGKKIQRTYLNGRLIFGEDARTPLTTIDAKSASLIQAYDETDEKSEILYGKNAQKRKVLNILTFEDFKAISSGEIKLEGGADKKRSIDNRQQERYYGYGKAGFYNEALQVAFDGAIDNRTPSLSNIQYKPGGYKRIWNAGSSISVKPDTNNKYTINYNYNNNYSSLTSIGNIIYFPTNQFKSQTSTTINSQISETGTHNITLSYEFLKRKNISIALDCPIRLKCSNGLYELQSEIQREAVLLSVIDSKITSEADEYNIFPRFTIDKSFRKHSLSFELSFNTTKSDYTSTRDYTLNSIGLSEQKILNTTSQDPTMSLQSKIQYNINIANHGWLTIESDIKYEKRTNDKLVLNAGTNVRDDALSSYILFYTTTIEERVIYQFIHRNHRFHMKIGYSGILLDYDEKFPDLSSIYRRFHAFIPEIDYTYEGKQGNLFNLTLSKKQIPLYPGDLRKQLNDNNLMFISGGNPNLKTSQEYSLQLRKYNIFQNEQSLSFSVNASLRCNTVIKNQIYFTTPTTLPQYPDYQFSAGATLTIPINSNNSYAITPMLNYDIRLSLIKSILKLSTGYSYENMQTGIDFKLIRTYKQAGKFDIGLTTNVSSKFKAEIKNNIQYNWFKNHTGYTDKSLSETAVANIRWDFWERTYLTGFYTMEYFRSSASNLTVENHTLNASLGCRLFKNHKGSLSFNAYDILDRTTNIATIINDQYISNTSKQLFSSYFTIAFEYWFNNAK